MINFTHTVESLQLEYINPNEPGQAARIHKKVWQWFCPGHHAYPVLVTEYENDPAGSRDGLAIILADPWCSICRKVQRATAQTEMAI